MGNFATGRHALGMCDRCGTAHKLNSLRFETVNFKRTNLRVCRDCFDIDHPQYQLARIRKEDPQALQNARPDAHTDRDNNQNTTGTSATGAVGTPTITIT